MPGFGVVILFGIIAISSTFEIGTLNKYSYETTVVLNEKCGQENDPKVVGHRLKSSVQLTAVWQNSKNPLQKLLKIDILNPKLFVPKKSSFEEHISDLDKVVTSTSFLLLEDGTPSKIWDDATEHYSLRNLKRGLASLLQFRKKDGERSEIDVSGSCDVFYKVEGNSVQRRKGNCVHPQFDKTLSQAYGVRSASTLHQSTSECEWKGSQQPTVSKCAVSENIKFISNAWHRPSLCINTKSVLVFEGNDKNQKKFEGKDLEGVIQDMKKSYEIELEEGDLVSILPATEEKPKKRQLKSSIAKLKDSLKNKNLPNLKSVTAFYKLLPAFRAASEGEILQVLNNDKWEDIRPRILDLVSSCATEKCLKAALEFFEAENEYNPTLESFVISLSILPRPSAFVLKEMKTFIEKKSHDEKIEATLLSTLGTILKTYAENHDVADPQVVEDVRVFLEKGLKKCKKDSESCSLNYLRSLRNAAHPRSVPVLLEYALRGGKESLESVLALKNIPPRSLPKESQTTLLKVFNQVGKRQDRSTRALAAEVLLGQHPGSDVLKGILGALSDQSDLEFTTFLESKIKNMMSTDEKLRDSIREILPEKYISYYYSLAQQGQSSLFKMPLVSLEGTNVTYGIEMELMEGGLLKRSVFDVSFENQAGASSLLSVGLFASGLGALAGGSEESSDDDSGPTAGLELGILGSALRPYVFFRSTSELMGHAWGGTASEQTPVLQCILSFSEDERVIVLNNGMLVRGQLRGVLSSDSSASVQISLWNRNSKSLVKNEGSLLVRGSVTVDGGFVVTQGAIQFTGATGIDFKIDLEFYESPFTTCLQMEQPEITVNFDVHRSTAVTGTKYQLRRTKKRVISIPARSFAFHQENNEMCEALNSSS